MKELRDFSRKHFDMMQKIEWNRPPKINFNWTHKTIDTTLAICAWAAKHKLNFVCEVKMVNNARRADVVIPELLEAQVIEIHDSESAQSLTEKNYDFTETGAVMCSVPADVEKALNILNHKYRLQGT